MKKKNIGNKILKIMLTSNMLISPMVLNTMTVFSREQETTASVQKIRDVTSVTIGEKSAILTIGSEIASSSSLNYLMVSYSPKAGDTEFNEGFTQDLKITINNGKFTGEIPTELAGKKPKITDTVFRYVDSSSPVNFNIEYTANNTGEPVTFTIDYAGTYLDESGESQLELVDDISLSVEIIDAALEEAKKEATEIINNLTNLTDEDKSGFISEIEEADTVNQVAEIVTAAKDKDTSNLQTAKDNAKNAIDSLEYLDEDTKNDYKNRVDEGTSPDDINSIIEEASQKNTENKNEQELNDAKNNGKESITNLKNISEDDKKNYNNRIDATKTVEEIADILNEATEKDGQILNDAKTKASETINGLINLNSDEKGSFNEQVDQAESTSDITEIVSNARNTDTANLEKAKAQALETINSLVNLSPDEREGFIDKVNNSDSIANVEHVVNNAKAQDTEDLEAVREVALKTVGDLKNLSEEIKADYISKIKVATAISGINNYVGVAVWEDTVIGLQNARKNAKDTLAGLEYLSEEEVADFSSRIDNANTIPEINYILNAAEAQNEYNKEQAELAVAKTNAIQTINDLKNLSEEQKNEFITRVNDAQTTTGVNAVLKDAGSLDSDLLEIEKNHAKDTIKNDFTNLSDDKKENYNDKITSATTIQEVADILAQAAEENEKQAFTPGDLNNDGVINILDLALLQEYIQNGTIPEGLDKDRFLKSADFNQDGVINILDLSALSQYIQNS